MADASRKPTTQELLDSGRWRLSRELYPLPPTRKEILSFIEEILEGGLVQRLVIQVDEPVRVERLRPIRQDDPVDPADIPEDDFLSAARNGVLEDLQFTPDLDPFLAVHAAFSDLSKKGAAPVALIVADRGRFSEWLGVDDDGFVFGVRVRPTAQMPEDAFLLCGTTNPEDPFTLVTHSIRVTMNLEETR